MDNWDEEEKVGLQTVLHTLSIVGTCNVVNISEVNTHATVTIGSNVVDIIVVHGGDTPEECFEYGKKFLNKLSQSRYGLVITRDVHDRMITEDIADRWSIFNAHESISEKGPNITNPDDRFNYRGYKNIQTCCFSATSVDNLKEQIDRLLGV